MTLVRYYSPFRELNAMRRDFNRFFVNENTGFNLPAVDVTETEDEYIFEIELPGFTKEEIEVTATVEELIIKAEHEVVSEDEEKEEDQSNFIRKERRSQKFQRSFKFGKPINPDNSQVQLENGILTVKITKSEEVKPVKLQIAQ